MNHYAHQDECSVSVLHMKIWNLFTIKEKSSLSLGTGKEYEQCQTLHFRPWQWKFRTRITCVSLACSPFFIILSFCFCLGFCLFVCFAFSFPLKQSLTLYPRLAPIVWWYFGLQASPTRNTCGYYLGYCGVGRPTEAAPS